MSERRKPAGDRLLEAAAQVADGRGTSDAAGFDPDQQRIIANLGRLASLKMAYERLASASGRSSPGGEGMPGKWGHLTISAEIGRGAFGVVYRAFDPVLQRQVALKLRREDAGSGATGYIEEARRLARVRHAHVLAVHGADVAGNCVGLWADLIDGRTVEQLLSGGPPLPRARVLQLARQLSGALAAIHEAGLVHGDIKAANVMIDERGNGEMHAVLMDFGAGSAPGVAPRFGSPLTMAPELLAGGRASDRSDIYSLGALLYRAALGRLHRPGSADAVQESRADLAPSVDRRGLRHALGGPGARLLLRMLAVQPDHRPAASAVIAALDDIERLPRRRARRLATALVVLALGTALAASLGALQRVRAERDRSERIKDFMVQGLQQASPLRASGPASVLDVLDHMAQELDGQLQGLDDARAEMRIVIGAAFAQFGETERGAVLLDEGIGQLRRAPRSQARDLGHALITHAAVLRRRGDTAAAFRAIGEAEDIFRSLPDNRDVREARIRIGALLGNLHNASNRPLSALHAHRETLVQRRALLGEADARLAVDYNNIAAAALRAGLAQEAVDAYSQAATLLEAQQRAKAGPMAMVQLGLAKALLQVPGRAQDSDAHRLRAQALYQANYPKGHPHQWMLDELAARSQLVQGDHAGAERLYARLLQSSAAEPDREAAARFQFGQALLAGGNATAAEQQFRQAARMASEGDPVATAAAAAVAHARWLGGAAGPPEAALRRAIAELAASDYAARPERRVLERWLDTATQPQAAH